MTDHRVKVWRRSTGERLPELPERLVKFNPDLTTEKPEIETVEGCCGEGLIEVTEVPEARTPTKKETKK